MLRVYDLGKRKKILIYCIAIKRKDEQEALDAETVADYRLSFVLFLSFLW